MRKKRVAFDISGLRYDTFEDTLEHFPDTLLGDRLRRNEYLNSSWVTQKL